MAHLVTSVLACAAHQEQRGTADRNNCRAVVSSRQSAGKDLMDIPTTIPQTKEDKTIFQTKKPHLHSLAAIRL